jgi:hypothetical protein
MLLLDLHSEIYEISILIRLLDDDWYSLVMILRTKLYYYENCHIFSYVGS